MKRAGAGCLDRRARGGWAVAAAVLLGFGSATQAAELPPVADFFRHDAMSRAVLSPSGRHVAVVTSLGGSKRQQLAVLDLQNPGESKALAGSEGADIRTVHWVNDDRLVFDRFDRQSPAGEQRSSGLFAVDRQGKEPPSLLWGEGHFFDTLRDGSDDIIVSENHMMSGELRSVSLGRKSTVTGQVRTITAPAPRAARFWALDTQGRPRAVVTSDAGKSRLYWKPTPESDWQLVREFDAFGHGSAPPWVMRVGPRNELYGLASVGGRDTASLVSFDIVGTEWQAQPLVSVEGFDFSGRPVFDSAGRLLGAHFTSDGPGSHWFDPAMKAMQQKIDALLPATANRIDCGACNQPTRVLVHSISDRQPGEYAIYDAERDRLEPLGSSRPWIRPAQMAMRDFQRFSARDGLSIPVYITRPLGASGPAPAVVLVHGGPYVRGGSWGWDAESQFLASRGYVVIEPEFRGSTGYGDTLYRAGFKQWGLAMQDDLADAALWAVKQGYADPKRMCIAGASYGGYATLMGLIKHPELFRCGVEWVGVSDIDLLYSIHWSDTSTSWKTYGMPTMIGDPKADAAQLAATSPLKRAAELRQPLLMAYGSNDRRVPLQHGTAMRDALRATNPQVEFVVYSGEAHSFMLESTHVDFWTRVERFLSRHLAPPP